MKNEIEKNSMHPLDALIVSLRVRDAGRIPIYITERPEQLIRGK